jgi:glycosyltransferase involved in cell wall biosynthesis
MKITFFSNFLNHHQTPFCDEMYERLKDDFTFVSTVKTPDSFLRNGYPDCSEYAYNLNSYFNEPSYNKALQLALESDIVITGAAPEKFIKQRLSQNKLTFRYSERFFKQGLWRLLNPRVIFPLLRDHTIHRNKNVYMLCTGAYVVQDLDLIFSYPNKKYKWGYFTAVKELNINQIILLKPLERIELIWVARLIDWKHPELAVKLAYELSKKGYNFHLSMIGSGEKLEEIEKLITKLNITEFVSLLGSIPNKEVLDQMEKSNIFIFTSDRNEGWGAVLNEAMGRGCAVVASNLIGAVPYLIEDNQNGLIFKSGDLSSLVQQTERLISDKAFREYLAKNAYNTMVAEWNPKKAASNFLLLGNSILEQQGVFIEKGPCSKA